MKYLNILRKKIALKMIFNCSAAIKKGSEKQAGFSLVEVIIALLILLVVLLGVFATFVYAINYNSGNNARSQGLTVLQKQAERMRSAKYTPTFTDPDLAGGVKAAVPANTLDGNQFKIDVTVDDDPFTDGVQINNSTTMKEVLIKVTLASPTPGWQTAVPTTIVMRRVRAN